MRGEFDEFTNLCNWTQKTLIQIQFVFFSSCRIKKTDWNQCGSRRLGTLNPETKFILDKLHVNMPVLLTTARSTLEEIEIDDAGDN